MKKHILLRSSSRRTVLLQLSLIIGVAISAIALQSYAANPAQFVQPTVAPPGGNAFAPLNVGLNVQKKNGGLEIGGSVKVGATTTPNATLDVNGNSFVKGNSIIWGNLSIGGPVIPGTKLNVVGNIASTGRIVANDMRAPIFYALNNTSYYVAPANTSYLNAVNFKTISSNYIKVGSSGIRFSNGSVQGTAATSKSPTSRTTSANECSVICCGAGETISGFFIARGDRESGADFISHVQLTNNGRCTTSAIRIGNACDSGAVGAICVAN